MYKLQSAKDSVHYDELKRKSSILEDAYKHEIALQERFLLNKLDIAWAEEQPLLGKRILVNGHVTLITLNFIKLLIDAGAEVHTTASRELAVHDNALIVIREAGIPFYLNSEVPLSMRDHYFDIVYDCGAGMLSLVVPNLGMVELTHTDPALYEGIDFPVITVDNSETKKLETSLGTGNALTRVLIRQVEIALMTSLYGFISVFEDRLFDSKETRNSCLVMLTMINMYKWLTDKYLVLGYGKVGKGIASSLKKAGVQESNIFIAETSFENIIEARREGYTTFHLDNEDEIASLKFSLKNEGCIQYVITATGVHGAVSHYFNLEDFEESAMLINMGTPDEYGDKFLSERILNQKKPANFMLEYPTEVKFLDPIFCILARGGVSLIEERTLRKGLNNISRTIDNQILAEWLRNIGKNTNLPQTKLNDELRQLQRIAAGAGNGAPERAAFCELLTKFGAIQSQPKTPLSCFSLNSK
jgi:adenosylhomocysteinase